jgi:hypothetical protein
MLVRYICKVCGTDLATAQAENGHDPRLGLALLTPEERSQVLLFQGETITVSTYCDDCESAPVPDASTRPLH